MQGRANEDELMVVMGKGRSVAVLKAMLHNSIAKRCSE